MLTYGSSKAASGRCHPIERSAFFLPGLLLAFADRPPEAVPARSVPDTL